MKTIRVLIADDEPLAREGIAVLLRDDPLFEVIAMCGDGLSAVQQIRMLKPQMAFLDIQMPRLSGLDAYAQLAPADRPAVVFVTAYNEHAVRAFEMCAIDYVVKPFTNQRFKAAVQRACGEILRGNFDDMQRRADELLRKLQVLDGKLAEKVGSSDRLAFEVGQRVPVPRSGGYPLARGDRRPCEHPRGRTLSRGAHDPYHDRAVARPDGLRARAPVIHRKPPPNQKSRYQLVRRP